MKRLVKSVYQALPFKRELYTMLKAVKVPPQQVYRHLHFHGAFPVGLEEGKQFKMIHHGHVIENEVFWNGIERGWEQHSMRIWRHMVKESEVVFDVGANTGIYALVAKALAPQAEVHAFEPVERVFKRLEANVQLNEMDIRCVNTAISDENGTAIIYDTHSDHTLSVSVNKNINPEPEKTFAVEIQRQTLDDYIQANGVSKMDCLKLDVEMHELEAMRGFAGHLHAFRPDMLVEVLNEEIASGMMNILQGMDYCYFNIDENRGISEVQELSKSDYYNFLICKASRAEEIRNLYGLG